MILSVSRRTDIPAFFSNWFINRLRDGHVMVRNPMNYHQISKISLSPELTDCIVFWTKNPKPLLPFIGEIEKKYSFYFQYTLNAYDLDIEPKLPRLEDKIKTFKELSRLIGKERIIWRYDPILISTKYNISWHVDAFTYLAKNLSSYVGNCVFSFLDFYPKIKKNIAIYDIQDIDTIMMHCLAKEMAKIGKKNNLILKTCAETIDLKKYNILPNKCVDPDIVSKIIGYEIKANKDKNQRQECGCIESIDIGQYNTCSHGCRYCYANFNFASINTLISQHNDYSQLLIGELSESDKVIERKIKSFRSQNKYNQLSLF